MMMAMILISYNNDDNDDDNDNYDEVDRDTATSPPVCPTSSLSLPFASCTLNQPLQDVSSSSIWQMYHYGKMYHHHHYGKMYHFGKMYHVSLSTSL